MQTLTVKDIIRATGGELEAKTAATAGLEIDNITIDSREVREGSLFSPIKGESRDGHDFINSALVHGASVSLTEKTVRVSEPGTIIRVKDTRRALGDIARYYKQKYPVKSVAITGSVGKTTTKDLVYAVLSERFRSYKTQKNFNNDLGVPLTIFGIEKEHEMAVIEMGMNHFGEIDYLAGIAKPDIGIITNIGMSHIENLGSREGILKAKMEIANGFTEKNTLYINGDDEYLKTVKGGSYKLVSFGTSPENNIYAKDIAPQGLDGVDFTVVYPGGEIKAHITRPGVHNVYNALAAVCAGLHFGVTPEEIARGLRDCEYSGERLEIIRHKDFEIINDCYNASPDSIRAALKVLSYSDKPRKVAILGDVLEMGGFAADAHRELGKDALQADMLITAGKNARELAEGAKAAGMKDVTSYDTTDELLKDIEKLVRPGDCVLVKASHGMKFVKITDAIREM